MDKRKGNGGHSTKAKGVDKRKNDFKTAINKAFKDEDVIHVLKTMYNLATQEADIQAAKLFLEYTAGKPSQQMDVTTNGDNISHNLKDIIGFTKSK